MYVFSIYFLEKYLDAIGLTFFFFTIFTTLSHFTSVQKFNQDGNTLLGETNL